MQNSMEISTEICWNSKLRKPKVKMTQKDCKFTEKSAHVTKTTAQSPIHSVFVLDTNSEKQRSNIAPEKHQITSPRESKQDLIKEKTEKSNISILQGCDLNMPVCLQSSQQKTGVQICSPPAHAQNTTPNITKRQKCSSESCPENKKADPKYRAKFCPVCSNSDATCEGPRPKREKVKGSRLKSTAPVSALTQNAKTNCCKCCCLLAEYFREVYRLFSLKDDSRVEQVLSEILDVAGCICADCFNFLKKLFDLLVVYKK